MTEGLTNEKLTKMSNDTNVYHTLYEKDLLG